MHILVLNGGSSSIKFSVFLVNSHSASAEPQSIMEGELSGIGGPDSTLKVRNLGAKDKESAIHSVTATSTAAGATLIFDQLTDTKLPKMDAVGYRVVHPGPKLQGHQKITQSVLEDLEDSFAFAPLHNPAAVGIIRLGLQRFPAVPHFACFDTVFHETMPPQANTYPLPGEWRQQGVRRYGFHGLSCEWIVRQLGREETLPKRLIIAHLGSGCSVTAVFDGYSVDTSMGLTPTGGVVMGTRPGDLDPGLILYLLRHQSGDRESAASAVEGILNRSAGIVGLSELPNDMKAVRKAAADGNQKAHLALQVFTRSVTKAIGSFCWLMGGVDAIAFSGGIGEHDVLSRAEILAGLETLGVSLDPALNAAAGSEFRRISVVASATPVFIVPAQEDRMIAIHVDRMATPVI